MADAIARFHAAERLTGISGESLSTLVGSNIIAEAIAAQTAAVQANTAAVADLAQQIYEDGMYDGDDEETEEDWDIDQPLDERLRGLGDA